MGLILGIETDTGQEIPFWFTVTDSKLLYRQLLDIADKPLNKVLKYFNLNLEPLSENKIVDREDDTLEDFISRDPDDKERIKYWYKKQAEREAAWQSPQTIIDAISSLVNALESHPSVFSELDIDDSYFTKGYLRQDLLDLIKMLDWCITNSIKKVRVTIS